MITAVALFISCAAVSLLTTWGVRNIAQKHGWVSYPKTARHVHKQPVPRLGGVGIFSGFVLSVSLISLVAVLLGRPIPFDLRKLLYITGPATIIFALGLWDDIRSLSPWVKFSVQALAAALLWAGGLRVVQIPTFFGMHHLSIATGLILTVFWVVWITNAFNLIDGVDGLAAGSALFSTVVVLLNSLIVGDRLSFLITAALAGSILGFLRFNFNPATIFLGDSGSLFIGFNLSALALGSAQKSPTLVAVAIPLVALGLPIVDTSLAVARRFISGKPLFSADREHIHHKLLEKGLSQRQAVLILYAVTAAFGAVALLLRYPGGRTTGAVLVIIGAIVLLGVQKLGYVEFFELRRVAQRTMEQREIIINNLALRRSKQDLLRAANFEEICSALVRGFSENDFEGFELNVVAPFAVSRSQAVPLRHSTQGLTYTWQKDPSQPTSSGWQLSLNLVSERGNVLGTFIAFRPYTEQPFMLDINLLTANFPTILAGAVERSLLGVAMDRSDTSAVIVAMSAEAAATRQ